MKSLTPLSPGSLPGESIIFCLAIQCSDYERRQLHMAAVYRFKGQLWLGDVASHYFSRRKLASETSNFFWIPIDLSIEDQQILSSKINVWLEKNIGRIPYSVASPGGIVFKDDVWVGKEPGQGLTCATFIVELFNELGIPFINSGCWMVRDGDQEWALNILHQLAELMDQEHVQAQKARIGEGIRIRPSDVAAAGLLIDEDMEEPLCFADVDPVSTELSKCLVVEAYSGGTVEAVGCKQRASTNCQR